MRSRARYVLGFVGAFVLITAACGTSAPQLPSPLSGTSQSKQPGPTAPEASPTPGFNKQEVTFQSGDLTLVGSLYKPDGAGPFPTVVWNHGDEKDPQSGPELDALAQIFVPAGYVLFAPVRRGQGKSQGQSLVDQMAQAQQSGGAAAAQKLFVQQMAGPQLDDQLAGLAFLKTQPFVNPDQLAVAGCGSGGVQTLLAAAKGAGYKAAVAESPGSDMWDGDTALQQSLTQAAQKTNVPVFLIQPDHDVSADPSYTLGQEFLKLGKAYSVEIVPPYGSQAEQGECFGGASGYHWWAEDVLAFIHEAFTPTAAMEESRPSRKLDGILKQRITLQSDGLTLEAFVYKPKGAGPFPGLIWNHGSEQDPVGSGEFDLVASLMVPQGYVLVTPARRGHSESQGTYIGDATEAERKAHGKDAAAQLMVKLMSTEQLDDQLAGLNYLKSLPYVDTTRLADIGCSYGGIETMFGAEAGEGFKAAVAISPGAESWDGNKPLEARLLQAADNVQIPVFVIHPAKDASLNPGFNLGPEFQKMGKPYGLKIFPPFGPENEQGHCFPGSGGGIWAPDVFTFLSYELH